MLSRRAMILATAAAAVPAELFARASQPRTKVRFRMPQKACDCHTHIFADPKHYPLAAQRSYTPEAASPQEMLSLHRALNIDRVVIVTPSVYGTDNRATAFGIQKLGVQRARGIAVVSPDASERDLATLDRQGFRGIRLNFATGGSLPDTIAMRARLQRAVKQVRPLDWHIQIYTNLTAVAELESELAASPVPVVLDHVCSAVPAAGPGQRGFDALERLVSKGGTYVKLTHRFLSTANHPAECSSIVKLLAAARADRMVWGTDWPHPDSSQRRPAMEVSPLEQIDDGMMLNHFGSFLSDQKTLQRILVENPARLYRFS
jgi:predicted TIM-barrel fold metal-dependent hydrolase